MIVVKQIMKKESNLFFPFDSFSSLLTLFLLLIFLSFSFSFPFFGSPKYNVFAFLKFLGFVSTS